jgi:cytochrome oxidase assembly protein ShyY1
MSFKLQNWKLALLALILMIFFISMGRWQLSRAEEKENLLKMYAARTKHAPLSAGTLAQTSDPRFFRAELRGEFDNQHTILLDNKIHDGKVGYEVYTLFKADGLSTAILVDRGFIPIGSSRSLLPAVRAITGKTTLTGMLNLPPGYVKLGKPADARDPLLPARVEYIQLTQLSTVFGQPLYPYVLTLNPGQIINMNPEKHRGYAVQWFAFAFTLLILFAALNRPRTHS